MKTQQKHNENTMKTQNQTYILVIHTCDFLYFIDNKLS
jgi:hypothetical protein